MQSFGILYFSLMQIITFLITLFAYISNRDYFSLFWVIGFGHSLSFLLFLWAFYTKSKKAIFYALFIILSSLSFSYASIGFTSITGFLFGMEYNLQKNVIIFYFNLWHDEYALVSSEDFIRLNFMPFIIFYVFIKNQIFYLNTNKKLKKITNKDNI